MHRHLLHRITTRRISALCRGILADGQPNRVAFVRAGNSDSCLLPTLYIRLSIPSSIELFGLRVCGALVVMESAKETEATRAGLPHGDASVFIDWLLLCRHHCKPKSPKSQDCSLVGALAQSKCLRFVDGNRLCACVRRLHIKYEVRNTHWVRMCVPVHTRQKIREIYCRDVVYCGLANESRIIAQLQSRCVVRNNHRVGVFGGSRYQSSRGEIQTLDSCECYSTRYLRGFNSRFDFLAL